MSRALERLRDAFGDPLLVRNDRGYERTVRGERVLRELESLIPGLRIWCEEKNSIQPETMKCFAWP
jgi:DNA-binding transcriptional LysR family regulator